MTRTEIQNKIKELELLLEQIKDENGFEDDPIFLLSIEEYERYKNNIPPRHLFWWLRSPGIRSKTASYVDFRGSVNTYGNIVDYGDNTVRPALKYENLESKIIKSKLNPKRFVFNDFPFIIIDEDNKIAISETSITERRFDSSDNNYSTSEIRKWLLDWYNLGEKDE